MKTQAYLDLKKKHEEELSNFPIAYAFNDQQLKDGLEKLGAEKSECVTVFGHGDIVKKTDAPRFIDMLKRHTEEIKEALRADEEFAEAAFRYEMDNHEYAISYSADEDVLGCFCISFKDLKEWGLEAAYRRARKAHMDYMHEIEII